MTKKVVIYDQIYVVYLSYIRNTEVFVGRLIITVKKNNTEKSKGSNGIRQWPTN